NYDMPYWTPISLSGNDTALSGIDGVSIKSDSLSIIDTVIDYMKENPNLNKKPDIPGITFESD
ncbi:hypothetical protein IJ798_02485, partial [Candidatus Saccharibacteria bacterium]|nr:hypothetical protein [Candidatus Saccharibacteria bacterium]